ncbi:hypothetical protein ACFPOU_12120 [Massilia jejuensis]|uniref:Uncharacterized protein n=1 Tax=Massilia jejuensis TaxID=648894 RepID=A0ABW0PGR4_9BURK
MAFHHHIQSLLLAGIRFPAAPSTETIAPPPALAPLVAAVTLEHAAANSRAVKAGNRYRSAFWALYLLSALAVLCAVMPLALGWDHGSHVMHAWAGFWAGLEVFVILVLGLLYRHGHHRDWQGQWLASRTEAELIGYLPLVAPLVFPAATGSTGNWYSELSGKTMQVPQSGAVNTLCARLGLGVAESLHGAWSDTAFVKQYVAWALAQFELQRQYHERLMLRSEALMYRVHKINAWLFMLTLVGALMHLVVHAMWLSFVTIFFPALAASLHGALAQTEAYRQAAISRRLSLELGNAMATIASHCPTLERDKIRDAIEAGLTSILEEHRDWHMLVRPHHLPLG